MNYFNMEHKVTGHIVVHYSRSVPNISSSRYRW